MQTLPEDVLSKFDALLKERAIPAFAHNNYRKWLRYFHDFRIKYAPPDSRSDQVRLFAEKLRSKNQTPEQIEQAVEAVSLFFALVKKEGAATTVNSTPPVPAPHHATENSLAQPASSSTLRSKPEMICEPPASSSSAPAATRLHGGKQYDEWRCLKKTEFPAWDKVLENLAAEIKLRHYSRNTLTHCGLDPQVPELPEKQGAGDAVSVGGEGLPYVSGGELQGILKSPEPGVHRLAVSVPAMLFTRILELTKTSPARKN